MDKKGEFPFWLAMAIVLLGTLIVMLIIMGSAGGKLQEFLDWFRGVF